ncbi:MAG: hypothetical protein AMS26_15130 [Bacteroides sp. SM23_62]|nr:MAG: hypothetical protein AMS26_15130 [Bacteroides sp. SM23_62]
MFSSRWFAVFIFLALARMTCLHGQEYYSQRAVIIEDLIEHIARNTVEDLDYQTLFDNLFQALEKPLNINTASREDLEKLQLLTDFQIASLHRYIGENGPLLTIYELPQVYGFSVGLAQMIEPLFTFDAAPRPLVMEGQKHRSSHQLLARVSAVLQEQKGYTDIPDSALAENPNARYLGNRLKIMTKYRYQRGDKLLIGYNGEKDAGEPFFSGENRHGFDFNSVYFRINEVWKFKHIMAGDYQIKTGQGLNLWSGLAFGKSPDIVNIRKRGSVLNHYSSTDENRFMRGASATIGLGEVDVTAFFSRKAVDANIVEDTLAEDPRFTSFQSSGYHRTPGEISDKDAVQETILGGYVSWNHKQFHLGGTAVHYLFDAVPEHLPDPNTQFDFTGNQNTNLGLDYTVSLNRMIFFGELGYSSFSGTIGMLNGASFDLHEQVSLSVLHRYFDKRFYALFGNAFSEGSDNNNEHGIYMGLEVRPFPHWRLTGYLDAYSFPWLSAQASAPSSGYDYHIQAEYTSRDQLRTYLRLRHKAKPSDVTPESANVSNIETEQTSHLRFHISYPVADGLSFQNRLEISHYKKGAGESEYGYLAYHDIIYKPPSFPLSFSFRYSMFDTESYFSRIYNYEHDVLYAFSIPSFFARGIRTYLNARWEISRHVDLWFKYALTCYRDRETISSGLNEIDGNKKSDLRVQLRLKF